MLREVKTFGERGATCKTELTGQEAEALVKTSAAAIASQEGLDTKHGLTAPAIGDIFLQIYSQMLSAINGKRDLYPARKI